MKKISLTQGKVTLVSDEDYDFLIQFTWHVIKLSNRNYFYAETWLDSRKVKMHKLIGSRIGLIGRINHKDKNGLNNQRENLRVCSESQRMTLSKIRSDNLSGFKGVSWHKHRNKWRAIITKDGEKHYLGYFSSKEEAALAYNKAAKELFGEFAFQNEIKI